MNSKLSDSRMVSGSTLAPQHACVEKLAHAAVRRRRTQLFAGKVAKAHRLARGKPVAGRHHAVDLLAQRRGDMDMRGADRREDQGDVRVEENRPIRHRHHSSATGRS